MVVFVVLLRKESWCMIKIFMGGAGVVDGEGVAVKDD